MVYDLRAFLAERVLDMNRTSRRRSGAFWTGWRTTWGGKAEDLTPKTKLQFYYEHDFVMAAAFEKAEHQSGR